MTMRSRFRWRAFIIAAVVMVILFVGIPTVFLLIARHQIVSAAQTATSMRLEEHMSEEVLSVRTLSGAELHQVANALPLTADAGIPGIVKFCFIPHHRVVLADATHGERTLEICFSCGQFQFADGALMPLPPAWREPLRQLFLRHGIPIQDDYRPAFLKEDDKNPE